MSGFKSLCAALAAGALCFAGNPPARAQCRLCDVPTTSLGADSEGAGVSLQIESSIDFDRLVLGGTGGGSALIRPDGGAASDGSVSGMSARAMVGSAVVKGEPGRAVRIELPTRIVLTSSSGGEIVFQDVTSDLPSLPRLDSAGRLSFHFGGRLTIRGDADGQYRGDLPITVEYL